MDYLVMGSILQSVANYAIIALFVVFQIVIYRRYFKREKPSHQLTSYMPTLLTTIGVLGTFSGICSGLFQFDASNIDGSIFFLLSGLKTAFITSIFGMLLAVLFKWRTIEKNATEETTEKDAASIDVSDLYNVMKEQKNILTSLEKAIGDNEESSIIGQFKLLRSDSNDHQKSNQTHLTQLNTHLKNINETVQNQAEEFEEFESKLWDQLQEFSEALSKSATETVIEALKSVIQDFNHNLTEQFGENFKQLNAAVLELVQWQENYKNQLQEMKAQYDHGVEAITKTENSVTQISEKTEAIPQTMERLQRIIETNQQQLAELEMHLAAFVDIKDKATNALPAIDAHIERALEGAKTANDKLAQGINDSTEKLQSTMKQSAEHYKSTADKTRNQLEKVAEQTKNFNESMQHEFKDSLNAVQKHMTQLHQQLGASSKQLSDIYQKGNETLSEAYKETNAQLIGDLEQHMNHLNSELKVGNEALKNSFKESNQMLVKETRTMSAAFAENLDQIKNSNSKLTESYEAAADHLMSEIKNIANDFEGNFQKMQHNLVDSIEKLAQTQTNQAHKIFSGLEDSIRASLSDTGESIEKQMKIFDQAAGHEIEKVMQAMGQALAQISGQFTNDYRALVSEMKNIAALARQYQSRK